MADEMTFFKEKLAYIFENHPFPTKNLEKSQKRGNKEKL